MSTHNICFHGKLEKIIPELSSNTPPYQVSCFNTFFFESIWVQTQDLLTQSQERYPLCYTSGKTHQIILKSFKAFVIFILLCTVNDVLLRARRLTAVTNKQKSQTEQFMKNFTQKEFQTHKLTHKTQVV